MNQILSTDMPNDNNKNRNKVKVRNYGPANITSILKFFGIAILIFGLLMIGSGAYSIVKNQIETKEQNLEPTISIENKTTTKILLKVMHQKAISKVEYWWNNGQKVTINGNNGQYIDKEVTIPTGKNTLHVLVQDIDGKEITYDKEYEIQSNINIQVVENRIKITYESNTLVSYMTYRWDDGEEVKVDINDTTISEEIDVIRGLHELTVIVVDENNNTDTKVQKINGVSKPKISISVDNEEKHFVVKLSDDEKLSKFEFILNGENNQVYELSLEEMDLKELEYTLPDGLDLKQGENTIKVKVYNSNGVTEEKEESFVKQ